MSQELEGTLTNTANLVGTFGSEGGGGTSNYNDLINKPSINSVTLQGNKTASQLGFANVATSGSYDDLSNKPTIPAAQVNSDWNAVSGVAEILNKPTLSAVATSGDYDDLTNKPTIPAAQVNSDWNSTSGVSEILNKPTVYQNAAVLPISANDSTDTKSYIDTVSTGTLTTSNTNISILRSKLIKMPNGIKYISACIQTTGAIGVGETILNLPTGYELVDSSTNFDLVGVTTTGIGIALYIYSGNQVRNNTAMSNGIVFNINSWCR